VLSGYGLLWNCKKRLSKKVFGIFFQEKIFEMLIKVGWPKNPARSAQATCGEALDFLPFFGSFFGQAKKNKKVKKMLAA
jgi:hypothetical protein